MKTIKARVHDDSPVTQRILTQAIDQGRTRIALNVQATTLSFLTELNALVIGFPDQSAILLPVANYPELSALSGEELGQVELGFGGQAICLEPHNLDISIAGLISASESLMAVASSLISARNGRRISAAKATASKANGLKGGRPRKTMAQT
jgi:hypothetical protein